MKTKTIKLADIVIDAGTQQREKINDDIVAEYAESITCGLKFPAVTAFFNGAEYILVDGFHRYWAHKSLGILEIESDIHEGTKREAILFSAGVNNSHGIRLTNADKRKAVLMLINDQEWSQWSDNKISKHCKVTQPFVSKIRKEVITVITHTDNTVNDGGVITVITPEPDVAKEEVETVSTSEEPEKPEYDEKEQEILELKDTVVSLDEENTRLKDALATNQLPDDEIESASVIIDDLRKRVNALESELISTRATRDKLMNTNAQLEKQCSYYQNKLKKAGIQ